MKALFAAPCTALLLASGAYAQSLTNAAARRAAEPFRETVFAMRRPDLFGALIANVAILNPTRLGAAQNGANQFAEMGDPNTAQGFRDLLLSDSFQLLASADDLPDTLLTVGLGDRRVEPWMSAKFAARALERFGDRRLVLLRTEPDAGHGVGSARDQVVEQYTDMWAFVLNQAGAEGFTAAGPAQ